MERAAPVAVDCALALQLYLQAMIYARGIQGPAVLGLYTQATMNIACQSELLRRHLASPWPIGPAWYITYNETLQWIARALGSNGQWGWQHDIPNGACTFFGEDGQWHTMLPVAFSTHMLSALEKLARVPAGSNAHPTEKGMDSGTRALAVTVIDCMLKMNHARDGISIRFATDTMSGLTGNDKAIEQAHQFFREA